MTIKTVEVLAGALLLLPVCARSQTASTKVDVDAIETAYRSPDGPPQRPVVFDRKASSDTGGLGPPGPYWPERAVRMGVSGAAVIQCAVGDTGALNDCKALAESPEGFGFEQAALLVAKTHHMSAAPLEGARDGDQARLLVLFDLSKGKH